MRRFVAMFVAFVAAAAVPGAATAAPGAGSGSSGGAAFAVSTPAEPVRAGTDGVVHTVLTLSNNGQRPLTVSLRSARVRALDDGKTQFVDEPDPRWSALADFPPTVHLDAAEYKSVPLTIRIPNGLLPDLYMLGFIAEAVPSNPTGDAVVVYNQIASLVTIEVPGPRNRQVQVQLDHIPFLHFGSTLTGAFRVRNLGEAAAMTRGQVRLDDRIRNQNVGMVQVSNSRELLPAGTSRHESFDYETDAWFLLVRPSVEVSYGNGTSTISAVSVAGTTTLVIPWRTVVVAALLLCACIAYAVVRHRQRARHRRAEMAIRRHRLVGRRRAARRREEPEASPRKVAPA